ncbi:MAG: flavin reductase [Candidatus Thorarchaeota archaeon]
MSKIEINSNGSPFPKPVVILGSIVDGKPNFFTVAWFNRMSRTPNIWGACMGKSKHTFKGIDEHKTFSVNFPDEDLVVKQITVVFALERTLTNQSCLTYSMGNSRLLQ